jgi:hypothetical protein
MFRFSAMMTAVAVSVLAATASYGADAFDLTIAKSGQYRSASFVVWCYGSGKASVGGEKGVHHVSMLVRDNPFKEWITVYFDPEQITEEKLLSLLRERRCPKATLDRPGEGKLTVMNPYLGAGGIVQFKTTSPPDGKALRVTLPEGWKWVGPESGSIDKEEGVTYFSAQAPAKASLGKCLISISSENAGEMKSSVEVVRCMNP